MCSVTVIVIVLLSCVQVVIYTLNEIQITEILSHNLTEKNISQEQLLTLQSNNGHGETEAPTIKEAEQLIVDTLDDVVLQSKDSVGDVVELIEKIIEIIFQFFVNPQGSGSSSSRYTAVVANSRTILSNASQHCISEEKSEINTLVAHSSASVHICFLSMSLDIQSSIPEIVTLVVEMSESLRNITNDITTCMVENPFLIGLPGCLNGVIKYAEAEYKTITQQINSTIINNLVTIERLVNQTEVCISQSSTQFVDQLNIILSSFVQCVTG